MVTNIIINKRESRLRLWNMTEQSNKYEKYIRVKNIGGK